MNESRANSSSSSSESPETPRRPIFERMSMSFERSSDKTQVTYEKISKLIEFVCFVNSSYIIVS